MLTENARDAATTPVEFTHGETVVRFHLPDAEDHIQKTIRTTRGFYEPQLLQDIQRRVSAGSFAVDVGANIGNHTVFLAKVCGLRVLALEPSPHCFAILERNIALNELDARVEARCVAAGAAAGHGRLIEAAATNLGQARVAPGEGTTDIRALDALIGDEHVGLIKIDVEGAELDVLRGAVSVIRRDQPLLYVEAMDAGAQQALRAFLAELGYFPVGQFNWTPTFLYLPCTTAAQQFHALLVRAELEDRQSTAEAQRWKSQAHELDAQRKALAAELERIRGQRQESHNAELATLRGELDEARARLAAHTERAAAAVAALRAAADTAALLRGDRTAALLRLRHFEADAAQTHARLTAEVHALTARLTEQDRQAQALVQERDALAAALARAAASTPYQLGEAVQIAARTAWSRWRLPASVRALLRAPEQRLPRLPAPPPVAPPRIGELPRAPLETRPAPALPYFRGEFDEFVDRSFSGQYSYFVIHYAGPASFPGARGIRAQELSRALAAGGAPTLLNVHRWTDFEPTPTHLQNLLFQSPLDLTPELARELTAQPCGATRGVFIVAYPHATVIDLIHRANANGWVTIYDCHQNWAALHELGFADWYRPSLEAFVLNHCDLTCCASRTHIEALRARNPAAEIRVLPNAYDPAFPGAAYQRRPAKPPRFGLFGHLAPQRIAWQPLVDVMRLRRQYRFDIIGHGQAQNLKLPTNATLLGPKSRAEIAQIAAEWSAGLVPYKSGALAEGVDPIKAYEYLALGLPIVAFDLPQLADHPGAKSVSTPEAFAAALDAALAHPPEAPQLDAFLAHSTWDARARQLLTWVDEIAARPNVIKTFHPAAVGASPA